MVYPFVLKNQNTKLIILVGLILAAGIGFHFLPVRQCFAELESYIDSLGRIGPLVVALGYVITTVLCIPGSAITIGTTNLFGFKTGFLVIFFGANLGALCAFLLCRTFLRKRVARWTEMNPKFRSLDRAIGRQGFKMVFLSRLSPAFPFTVPSLRLRRCDSGMLPGIFLYVYIGAAARDALAGDAAASADFFQLALKYVGLLATVAVVVIVTRIARKALRAAEQIQEEAR